MGGGALGPQSCVFPSLPGWYLGEGGAEGVRRVSVCVASLEGRVWSLRSPGRGFTQLDSEHTVLTAALASGWTVWLVEGLRDE